MKRLIILFALLIAMPCEARMNVGIVGGGVVSAGVENCTTSEIVPTATTLSTDWTAWPSGTILDAINELIAGRDTNDSATSDDHLYAYLTMRVSLPGDCDVTAIRAEIYADGSTESITMDVDISNDNSSYTSAQSVSLINNTPTAFPKTFSTLSWTTPTYCYVRFKPTSATYNHARIFSLSITVNP